MEHFNLRGAVEMEAIEMLDKLFSNCEDKDRGEWAQYIYDSWQRGGKEAEPDFRKWLKLIVEYS